MSNIFLGILFAITAVAVSPFMNALIKRYSEERKIFDKSFWNDVKFDLKLAIVETIVITVLYVFLSTTPQFFIYAFLGSMLIIAAKVDINAQIIPNGLNFVGFLVGICLTYVICVNDIYVGLDRLFGMLVGAGVFLLIAGLAWVVYRREGMGLGDVKLMGVLGLFFGWQNIIQIFLMSFIIGAVISIFLLATKKKKMDDYIAFGPFIVISAIITMVVPASTIVPLILSR